MDHQIHINLIMSKVQNKLSYKFMIHLWSLTSNLQPTVEIPQESPRFLGINFRWNIFRGVYQFPCFFRWGFLTWIVFPLRQQLHRERVRNMNLGVKFRWGKTCGGGLGLFGKSELFGVSKIVPRPQKGRLFQDDNLLSFPYKTTNFQREGGSFQTVINLYTWLDGGLCWMGI